MIGWVGGGGIAGGIVSGFGLKAFVPVVGTANLIYVLGFSCSAFQNIEVLGSMMRVLADRLKGMT
jgi:hypothetical protein